jgi:hypothetical protein
MKFGPGDKITACLFETPMETCDTCGQAGFGVAVIQPENGSERKVALCGTHFIEACDLYPELRELAQRKLDSQERTAVIRRSILCPKCGKFLDLGRDAAYDIILATGIVCDHCGAELIIEKNIARLEVEPS